eukprot:366380-Chlamydomonas_euryale.AAC.2
MSGVTQPPHGDGGVPQGAPVHPAAHGAGAAPQTPVSAVQPGAAPMQGYNQSAEFFLSNYRLGRTLGVGSFGKVCKRQPKSWFAHSHALPKERAVLG